MYNWIGISATNYAFLLFSTFIVFLQVGGGSFIQEGLEHQPLTRGVTLVPCKSKLSRAFS